jgi:cleavage stimulation factor subunit 3
LQSNLTPSSFVLNFAYAELQEAKKEYPEVHATFEKFIAVLRSNLEALESKINSATSSFSSTGSTTTNAAWNPNTNVSTSVAPTTEAGVHSNNSSFATQSADEKPPKSKELAERRTEYGLVWIVYMRFGRRAEGIKSSRAIFAKARKCRWTPWEVFEAAGETNIYSHIPISVADVFSLSITRISLHEVDGCSQPNFRKRHEHIWRRD